MGKRYTLYRDATGRLRAEAAPAGNPVVADFLFTDVREDKGRCDTLLDMIERTRAGADEALEAVGNLYVLILHKDGARIENLYDGQAPSAEISLDELAALLNDWRRQLA
ncbi:MAG: hypothetical protein HY850_01630 [Betaproteobacteria bacterium]|nr:hypothetical protein [Betaproteobacteria bacterium]